MEYDLEKPESWIVYPAPPCETAFDAELIKIGGLNPHGQPMLRKVWGATHRSKGTLVYKLCDTDPVLVGHEFRDPKTGGTRRVKTLAEVPAGVLVTLPVYEGLELGELRWIIEVWRSPEELKKQGYFDESLRHNVIEDFKLHGEARKEFLAMVDAGEDPERALMKVENQMFRARGTKIDLEIKEYFDPEWRRNGDYQFFFRLERKNGSYHPADSEALEGIRMIWHYNQTVSPAEHEANLANERDREAQDLERRRAELWSPDSIEQCRRESAQIEQAV